MNFAKSLSTPSVTASENTENRESLAFYFESKIYLVFHTISNTNDYILKECQNISDKPVVIWFSTFGGEGGGVLFQPSVFIVR